MSLLFNEGERRAAEELARRRGRVNFMSVGTQVEVLNLVKRKKLEEEAAAERKMAAIAALDAATAEKYGGEKNWQEIYNGPRDEYRRLHQAITANPTLPAEQAQVAVTTAMGLEREAEEKRQTILADQTDESLRRLNKATQKSQPPKPKHPLHQIVKKDRQLERELRPKPRKPSKEDWKIEATKSSAWKRALEWFKMTPRQQAAAEAAIENKMNLEDGLVGQTLALQAAQDELAASGKLEQMDLFGYVWPVDEK